MNDSCPLCSDNKTSLFTRDKHRHYAHCEQCDLIFVPSQYHLNKPEEKALYDHHQNHPNDQGYCDFLTTLVNPLVTLLKPGMCGLDYGSGPGPTLHSLLAKRGFPTSIYDPYYHNNTIKLKSHYDFVTATEVVEHFNKPEQSWQQLISLVKPNGYIGIMTLRHDTVKDFDNWWYKNDRTHVMFYSLKTWQALCGLFNLQLAYYNHRVAIFQLNKKGKNTPS